MAATYYPFDLDPILKVPHIQSVECQCEPELGYRPYTTAKVLFPINYLKKVDKAFRAGNRFYFEGTFKPNNIITFLGWFHSISHHGESPVFECEVSVDGNVSIEAGEGI